jgi:hypothetical protein
MRKIAAAGISIDQIVDSWIPLPRQQCDAQGLSDIEDERKRLGSRLRLLLTDPPPRRSGLDGHQIRMLHKLAECTEELKRSHHSLLEYGRLGFNGTDITNSTGVERGLICKLQNHPYRVEHSRPHLAKAADLLQAGLPRARKLVLRACISLLPIQILEFHHDPDIQVDDALRRDAEVAIRAALVDAGKADGAIVSISLPVGCHGALAQIVDGCFIFVVPTRLSTETRRAVAHELHHLANRIDRGVEGDQEIVIARTEIIS